MNAILGMTDLALDTFLTGDQRQYLTTVKSAADALLGIINDILDFAKIEAGRFELDPANFSMSSVLGSTVRAPVRARAQKGAGTGLPTAARRARCADRRRRPASPGARQSRRQRCQVHRTRRGRGAGGNRRGASARGRGPPAFRGDGHRHRNPARETGNNLPSIRAGGHFVHAQLRGHRPGPDHCRPVGGPHGWRDHRGQRAGPG